MDAIEIARQRADKLHHKAVSRGLDPWNSYSFAVGEAEFRNVEVEKCSKNSDELNGGRAFFDSTYRLITHEDYGTPFEQAFLIAHEIGHIELGDDTQDEYVINIDPSCTSDFDPSEISRIVDYNHRQRREVQMDLFAREFLLPRSVVKKLHLEYHMTCSDIADKLGAPFDVVAQQMFDAMLLPIVENEVNEITRDMPLNEKQEKAVNHLGTAFLLQAGPGTGKTQTLIARVEKLLNEQIDPKQILLLTFSNKAASEIAERIARKKPHEAAALWVGTFHGFGLDLLKRFHDLLELPIEPKLLDRLGAVELLEEEFLRLNLKHYRNLYDPTQNILDILNAISRAKDEVTDALQYRTFAENMLTKAITDEEHETAEQALEVARVYEVYEKLKKQKGCLDFGDLVMLPVQLLEANPELRQKLQNHYLHILVDEYQDVNRSSIRLLKALKPEGNNLWVVGDAKQSIYRFRGASSFNISRFCVEDFPNAVTESLKINYRSSSEIVTAFSNFASVMKTGGTGSDLTADRPSSGITPEINTVESGDMIISAIAESINRMSASGFSFREQVVLCRGNEKLTDLAKNLEGLGIPVLFLGSLFERPEIKDLISLISLLIDKRLSGIIRLACWTEFDMSMEDVKQILDHFQTNQEEFSTCDISALTLSPEGLTSFSKLRNLLRDFNKDSHPWYVLASVLLDRSRIIAELATSNSVGKKSEGIAIWKFMNFARQQLEGNAFPIVKMMNRIRRLRKLNEDRNLSQLPIAAQNIDAVQLMTIHGSKGLEFPIVHLFGVNHDTLPGAFKKTKCPPPEGMIVGGIGSSNDLAKEAHDNEQECLFYVAMSRARERLFFYGARTKGIKKTKRTLSVFLEKLGPISRIETVPKIKLPIILEKVPLEFKGNVSFSANALDLYDRCPRRFLYTHILSIGGHRQETAFMQMHEVVRNVFQTLLGISNDDLTDWNQVLEANFEKFGLNKHGYINDYKKIAEMMLNSFIQSREGAIVENSDRLILNAGGINITINVDEILLRDNIRTLRYISTSHMPSSTIKNIKYAAFSLAAKKAFPNSSAELVYLADNKIYPLDFKEKFLNDCENKIIEIVSRIHMGEFKLADSAFNCPNCPALFICGNVPKGRLKKEF